MGLPLLLWVIFALMIGWAGEEKNVGFLGAFSVSLFLSPFIGMLVITISPKKDQFKHDN